MAGMLFAKGDAPDFARDGADWPFREASAFVEADGHVWHIQRHGEGPAALLLHGTGASTHSMAPLGAQLAEDFEVVAVDLPGHGFTRSPVAAFPTLPGVARDLGRLLARLKIRPELVVGHSAGAAVMFRLILDGVLAPRLAVSVNGALSPFKGAAGFLFPAMARMLYLNPVTPHLFAAGARRRSRIAALIEQTGSHIDEEGVQRYQRLLTRAGHVAGALRMMAYWDLAPLARDLPKLATRTLFIAGDADAAVPPVETIEAAALVHSAELRILESLGHLAHEEDPATVAAVVRDAFKRAADAGTAR